MKFLVEKIDKSELTTREFCMAGILLFLLGLVIGIVFSPKGERTIGCNNGNNNSGCLRASASDDDDEEE